jgi:hypothetical protein
MTRRTIPDPAELEAIRRALAPAAEGAVSLRVEGEEGGAVIHVFDAYDCKGTEAEIEGLLRGRKLVWRIVWH